MLRSSSQAPIRLRTSAIALAGLALLLPACGGDDSGSGSGNGSARVGIATDEELATEAFEAGVEFAGEGLFDRAIEEFNQAVTFAPENSRYRMAMGEVYMRIGYPVQAMTVFKEALAVDPGNAVIHAKLGVLEVQNKRIAEGIAYLRKAAELDDNLADVHYRLGQALAYMSDVKVGSNLRNHEQLDEAVDQIRRAAELNPLSDKYAYTLGRMLESRNEPDAAMSSYREAVKLNPDNIEAHLYLANLLVERNEVEEGRKHLDAAAALDPDERRVHFQFGLLAEQSEDMEGARAAYQRCIELDPTSDTTYFRLANVLRRLGEDDEADLMQGEFEYWGDIHTKYQYWLQESKAKRDDPNVLAQLGEKAYLLGRIEESVQWLKLARNADETNALSNAYLGLIFQENGNALEAQPLLERAIELGLDGEEIQKSLAASMMDLDKFEEAAAVFGRLAEAGPDVAANHYNLGVASLKMGALDAAAEQLAKAVALDGDYLKARFALGAVHFEKKEFEAAASEYRAILELDPENADAKSALETALAGDQG